jgi:hypothetical protein
VTWLTWARPRLLHLGSAQLRHDTAAVGDPVEGVVVEGEQHPVGGGMDVSLQVAKAEVDSASERGEAVLQAVGASVGRVVLPESAIRVRLCGATG